MLGTLSYDPRLGCRYNESATAGRKAPMTVELPFAGEDPTASGPERKDESASVALTPVPKPTRRIVALDGLRGIAALMVLFHHTLLMLPDFANAEWGISGAQVNGPFEWLLIRTPLRLIWSGQARALLFFVLSGFVLALPWLNGRTAPYPHFVFSRFCRIYPPYLIAMLIAAAGSFLLGGHELIHATIFFNQLGWAFQPSWRAVSSISAVLDNRSSEYMNEGMWTLVWEIRVGLIFPLLMMPIMRWQNRGLIGLLFALVLLHHLMAWCFGVQVSAAQDDAPQQIFYYAEFFAFGAAVATNRRWITAILSRSWRLGPICLVFGCLVCWIPWRIEDDRMIALGAAIILAAIVGSAKIQPWLETSPLLWLGRQSYSLYLTHVPVIMVVIIAFNGRVPLAMCGLVIPLALAISWAFHGWVEIPSVALAQRLPGFLQKTLERTSPRTIRPVATRQTAPP